MKEGIVLLHGILKTNRCMENIAYFLENKNYKILNIDFPSSKHDIESIARLIHLQIKDFAHQVTKIHFVGYSMGGLIIRTYLNLYQLNNLGRVIMIGTPNKGSEIADFLQRFYLYRMLYGPSGQQLITNQSEFKHIFGVINYELGIIAGISSFNLIANEIIGQENDGRVSVINTKAEGMKEHVTVRSSHMGLMSNKKIWQLTFKFLSTGSFKS